MFSFGIYIDTGLNFSDLVTDLTFVPSQTDPDQIASFAQINQSFDIETMLANAGLGSIESIFGNSSVNEPVWNLVAGDATQLANPSGTLFGPPVTPQIGLSLLTTLDAPDAPFNGNSVSYRKFISKL